MSNSQGKKKQRCHVQMPKFLLKEFTHLNKKGDRVIWCIDIKNDYLICEKGMSRLGITVNEYDYLTEQQLSSVIEQPFARIKERIKCAVKDENEISFTQNDITIIKNFVRASILRNPKIIESVKKKSVYAQFVTGLNHSVILDYGMVGQCASDILNRMGIAIFVNKTDAEFVLPQCCIYEFEILTQEDAKYIMLPISSQLAIALVPPNSEYNRSFVMVEKNEVIEQFNKKAIQGEVKENFNNNNCFIVAKNRVYLEKLIACKDIL